MNLKLVHNITTQDMLISLFKEHDEALRIAARTEDLIIEMGRSYIAEKYPHSKEYLKPTLARIRGEVG
jgi:hypothetical protein